MALETVWLSIIAFSTGAKQIIPLTELLQFEVPELIAEKRSDMGAALKLLSKKIDKEVIPTTNEQKGDWRPFVFLMTDGGSSDAWKLNADKIRERQNKGNLFFLAAGFGAKIYTERLARITPNVVISESSDPESFARYLAWVSTSISRSCQVGPEKKDIFAGIPTPKGFKKM